MIAWRELDALMAEWVMGWKLVPDDAYCDTKTAIQNGWYCWVDDKGYEIAGQLEENAFSTNIAAAWQVVECLLPKYSRYITIYFDGMNWIIELTHADTREKIVRSDTSAPYAICLAALKVVGYEDNKG